MERRSGKYVGAGTALRQISLATGGTLTPKRSGKSRRSLLVDPPSVYFLVQIAPNAGFGIKNLKKISGGDTPGRPPSAAGGDPHPQHRARTHSQHGYTPCAGAQAPPLLGPRSRKPFPKVKIYHYTHAAPTGFSSS